QSDPSTYRFSHRDERIAANCGLGTFSRFAVVNQRSVIPVNKSIPLSVVAVASCGVLTGWGSAVHAAETRLGDMVLVLGAGGVGVNAVQGAKLAGAREIIVVDTNVNKLEFAERFGATRVFSSMEEAAT